MVGGLIGLVVHVAEATILGWTPYPALMALNIALPSVLASVVWLAGQQARWANSRVRQYPYIAPTQLWPRSKSSSPD
jgi:hypothetical protein